MKRIIVAFGVCVLFIMVCGNIVFAAENTGSIKGAITWQYNNFVGTKGDVGAKIELIPESFDINNITVDEESAWVVGDRVPKESNIFIAHADGYGNYEINGVPSGTYMLLIVSNKTTRDFYVEPSKSPFEQYMRDWKNFKLCMLSVNKYTYRYVTIREGITSVESYDFGNTYI